VQISVLVDSFSGPCESLLGTTQRVWVTDTAADKHHLTGHTRGYVQVGALDASLGRLIWCTSRSMGVGRGRRWGVSPPRPQLEDILNGHLLDWACIVALVAPMGYL
jgi:hypothetical protein